MGRTEIRGGQIRDETIDSADLASGSIKAGELSAQCISGQATITSTDTTSDRLLIWDATDSALKQVSIGNLGVTASPAGSDTQMQYNNGGSLGGASKLIYDDSNHRLGVGSTSPPANILSVYGNVSGDYVTIIDNDQSSAGHGLKVTGDGSGTGTNLFDVESGTTTVFRVRADGKVAIGETADGGIPTQVEALTVNGDLSFRDYLKRRGDSNTYIGMPANDQMELAAGGVTFTSIIRTAAGTGSITFNDDGDDVDFIVESPQESKAIYLHAQNEVLHINHNDSGFKTKIHSTHGEAITVNNNGVIINDASAAGNDFRIESNNDTHIFFVDAGNEKIGIGTDAPAETLDVDGIVKATSLRTPLIEHADGDDAITIEDGGYLKFNAGVKYSPAVQVNTDTNGSEGDDYIKIAEISKAQLDAYESCNAAFLVSMPAASYNQSFDHNTDYIVNVRIGKGGSIVAATSVHVAAMPIDATEGLSDWDPSSDIIVNYSSDGTVGDLWVKVPSYYSNVFVTHMGSSDNVDSADYESEGWKICTGQSWVSGAPGSNTNVFGTWASTVLSKLGIGTPDPDRKLDILDTSNPQLRLTQADGAKYVDIQANAAGDLEITGVSTDTDHSHLRFIAAGNAGMVIQSQAADGDAQLGFSVDAGSSLAFSIGVDDGDGDSFKIGTSTIDTNTRLTIDSSGKVGIGTTTPGSGLHVADSVSLPVGSLRTSNYSIAEDDFCIVADCNSSAFTLTLPSATNTMAGRIYTIKRMDSGNSGGGNILTVSRNGKNIDNMTDDMELANLDAVILQCIGADGGWIRIGAFMLPMP